ncbi:MAG: hypothetical protein ABL958_19975 [Bdellovibrionia bacterium]
MVKFAKLLFRLWQKLGLLIGAVTAPILHSIFFFGLITPIGLVFRAIRRDRLALKKQTSESYWIDLPERNSGYERLF